MSRQNKFDRATYYIGVASALLIASSIFLLAVVTAMGFDEKLIDVKLFLIGAIPLGMAGLFHGMTYYFKAQQVVREEPVLFRLSEKQRDWIYGVAVLIFSVLPMCLLASLVDPNFSVFQIPFALELGLIFAVLAMGIPAIHAYYKHR